MATPKKAAPKEKKAVTKVVAKVASKTTPKADKYVYAVGRRKKAVAQIRFFADAKAEGFDVLVNGRSYEKYFNTHEQREAVLAPFKAVGKEAGKVTVHIMGGGLSGQADAVKLGIARALVAHDALLRPSLRSFELLTRDPRSVERKKPGLKKARRAPQWSKR